MTGAHINIETFFNFISRQPEKMLNSPLLAVHYSCQPEGLTSSFINNALL